MIKTQRIAHEDDLGEQLYAKLEALVGVYRPLTPEVDIVYDLGCAGDRMAALLTWMHRRWGVDFSELTDRDVPLSRPASDFHTWSGRRRFRGMTVGAALEAMRTKHWKQP